MWLSPYTITKLNSPLSYQLDIGTRKKQSFYIQLLKRYEEREDSVLITRDTTVLQPDTKEDTTEDTYTEVVVSGQVEVEDRDKDMNSSVMCRFPENK